MAKYMHIIHTYIHLCMYAKKKKRIKGKKKSMHARDSPGMKEFKSISHTHTRARAGKSSLGKKEKKKKKKTNNECEWTKGLCYSKFLFGF